MKIDLKRVGDLVTLEAEGSPEDLAAFCRLSGLDVEGKGVMIPGPKGDKGDAGPVGPQGPMGLSGLSGVASGARGCVCPPGTELGCGSSGCPRKGFHFGATTCQVSTSTASSEAIKAALHHTRGPIPLDAA